MKQALTLEIVLTKRSVINKLEKTSLTFQQFKNLLYLCVWEYFKHSKDLKPFLSVWRNLSKEKKTYPLKMKELKSGRKH